VPEVKPIASLSRIGDNSPQMTANFFGMPKDVWIGIALGVSVIVNVFLILSYRTLERETRMYQYYLLELDAKFIGAGLKKPDEAIAKKLQKQE
jgi:hypothetical protein